MKNDEVLPDEPSRIVISGLILDPQTPNSDEPALTSIWFEPGCLPL